MKQYDLNKKYKTALKHLKKGILIYLHLVAQLVNITYWVKNHRLVTYQKIN